MEPRDCEDLVVLTACDNAKSAVSGILSREKSLGIRPIRATFYVHPGRDPGCYRHAAEFLRAHAARFRHAIVVFDREGCGRDATPARELEKDVEGRLHSSGWKDRAAVIVCDPELDIWVWSQSPHVESKLGWKGRSPDLVSWLRNRELLEDGALKPRRPKEALEAALREVRKPRSSAVYKALAEVVSFQGCVDPAFTRLREKLVEWFPAA